MTASDSGRNGAPIRVPSWSMRTMSPSPPAVTAYTTPSSDCAGML